MYAGQLETLDFIARRTAIRSDLPWVDSFVVMAKDAVSDLIIFEVFRKVDVDGSPIFPRRNDRQPVCHLFFHIGREADPAIRDRAP